MLEQKWIEKAAAGNREAFNILVSRYKGYAMAAILPVIRDPEQAQDVLQETFLQVFRSLPRFKGGRFKAWLGRIAVNKAIDWKRKHSNHVREVGLDDLCEQPGLITRSAEAQFLSNEDHNRLLELRSTIDGSMHIMGRAEVYAPSKADALELLDQLSVDAHQVGDTLYVRLDSPSRPRSRTFSFGIREVDYVVFMPGNMAMAVQDESRHYQATRLIIDHLQAFKTVGKDTAEN